MNDKALGQSEATPWVSRRIWSSPERAKQCANGCWILFVVSPLQGLGQDYCLPRAALHSALGWYVLGPSGRLVYKRQNITNRQL